MQYCNTHELGSLQRTETICEWPSIASQHSNNPSCNNIENFDWILDNKRNNSVKSLSVGDVSLPVELPRSNIAVEDEVAIQLANEAARVNKTLYGFSNECMQAFMKILHEHASAEEIYPYWMQSKMSKEFDGMPRVSRGMTDFLIRELYPKNS